MTKEELKNTIKELQEQDKILFEIFNRREEISREAKENGSYNELWKMLFADGEKSSYFLNY